MVRTFAVAFLLSCLVASAPAQAQPAPAAAAVPNGAPAIKQFVKKPAPKAKTAAKLPAPTESGPCQIGVIPAIGNQFVVQKVGLMVFGNEETAVPIDAWGLDDLVVARVRAAAPGAVVQKIAYAKGAFEPYYNPSLELFRNFRDDLTAVVRQVAAKASCERYVVVTRSSAQFSTTNQRVQGVGIVHRDNPIKSQTYLFALTFVHLYDGQTFDVIERRAASTDEETLESRLLGLNQIRGPDRELDEGSFPAIPAEAGANPALRDGVRALLTASLDHTLSEMLKQEAKETSR
jgi:hypothetical protein